MFTSKINELSNKIKKKENIDLSSQPFKESLDFKNLKSPSESLNN